MSQRYSPLTRITAQNVKSLEQKWVYHVESLQKLEASPLVVDGVVYIPQPPNDVIAIDGRTGRAFWIYQYRPAPDAKPCCGFVNRGLAYAHQKEYEHAVADFTEAIRLDPKNAAAFTNRGVAYAAKGESARAKADFDQAKNVTRR